MPVVPAPERLRQEGWHEFKTRLSLTRNHQPGTTPHSESLCNCWGVEQVLRFWVQGIVLSSLKHADGMVPTSAQESFSSCLSFSVSQSMRKLSTKEAELSLLPPALAFPRTGTCKPGWRSWRPVSAAPPPPSAGGVAAPVLKELAGSLTPAQPACAVMGPRTVAPSPTCPTAVVSILQSTPRGYFGGLEEALGSQVTSLSPPQAAATMGSLMVTGRPSPQMPVPPATVW